MRLALISDLHANAVALDAVLRDAERAGADAVICLGDTATLGPEPRGVLDRLRAAAIPCIQGNHDAFLLDPALLATYTEAPVVVAAVDWARERLRPADRAFLEGFATDLRVELGPGVVARLFHGTPRSHSEELYPTTPDDEAEAMLGALDAALFAGGHTHLAMARSLRGALLVNPGSVGQPFREANHRGPPVILNHAAYAIVGARDGEPYAELRRVRPDRTALVTSVTRGDGASCPVAGSLRAAWAS